MVRGITASAAMVTVRGTDERLFSALGSDEWLTIYATAIEHGWQPVTKDQRMLNYRADRTIGVW